ncbi:MAG: hypothetical protein ACT4ON_07935 [Bacteroidota bacterium]
MTETLRNMDSFFKDREKEFYNRYFKKIYKGRIAKASDRKFSMEEYGKLFRFETEFGIEVNDNYKAFISFFETHNKLGHSINSAIRLLRRQKNEVTTIDNSSFKSVPNSSSQTDIHFFKKIKVKGEKNATVNGKESNPFKNKWSNHFSQQTDKELITEYASWKAKKRFYEFLQSELMQLQSGSISETAVQETTIIKNKDHTTRRQTLAIYYLDLHFKVNCEGKDAALIRFIQFLTDKNIDNITKIFRNPLKNSEKKKIRADEELLKDLKYIRTYFEDLGLTSVVKKIDDDIITIS